MKAVEAKIRRYGEKVLINVPVKLFSDTLFPFLHNKTVEEIVIEIKGKSIIIRKRENGS